MKCDISKLHQHMQAYTKRMKHNIIIGYFIHAVTFDKAECHCSLGR